MKLMPIFGKRPEMMGAQRHQGGAHIVAGKAPVDIIAAARSIS